jgi:hypothetical protein
VGVRLQCVRTYRENFLVRESRQISRKKKNSSFWKDIVSEVTNFYALILEETLLAGPPGCDRSAPTALLRGVSVLNGRDFGETPVCQAMRIHRACPPAGRMAWKKCPISPVRRVFPGACRQNKSLDPQKHNSESSVCP